MQVNGTAKPMAFSYSMNFYLGGYGGGYGGSSALSSNRLFLKSSEILDPRPDRLFVFTDRRPDAVYWSSFVVDMQGYAPRNPAAYRFNEYFPAFYHDGAATFSYADGHGEIQRWQEVRTTPPLSPPGGVIGNLLVPSPRNSDIGWLQARATRPK